MAAHTPLSQLPEHVSLEVNVSYSWAITIYRFFIRLFFFIKNNNNNSPPKSVMWPNLVFFSCCEISYHAEFIVCSLLTTCLCFGKENDKNVGSLDSVDSVLFIFAQCASVTANSIGTGSCHQQSIYCSAVYNHLAVLN